MSNDPGIICFRHCTSQNIFCTSVPEYCPICRSLVENFILDPFSIPYPYKNAAHFPTAIVIRPSHGSFLKEYKISDDLHIAVTNSCGIVIEFDRHGIVIDDYTKWTCCIALKIVPSSWDAHWDDVLECMLKDSKWKAHCYHESSMNCFNFVLEFLKNVNYPDLIFTSKEDLCGKLLLPKIHDAIKYNSLLHSVELNSYYVSH